MKTEIYQVLKGRNLISGSVFFDNSELIYHRDLLNFKFNIGAALLIFLVNLANCIIKYQNNSTSMFYLFAGLVIGTVALLIGSVLEYQKVKKLNNRIFLFSEINQIKAKEKGDLVILAFEFLDHTKFQLKIIKNSDYSEFINKYFSKIK